MKQKIRLLAIAVVLSLAGFFLFTADVLAADIAFSGRTFVDGVQVSGVKVILHARFYSDSQQRFKVLKFQTVSGSNGEYAFSFDRPAFYWPVSAELFSSSTPVYPDDYCNGYRSVGMVMGANRRHVYVTCHDLPDPPEDI
ncbi:MAG: hypothetical protein EHM45_23990 [Desulfobacteraceae bacterium]|nr:MAG: hypothetical protein EHM45_23990 [Desulfobacteraceae bacterium]